MESTSIADDRLAYSVSEATRVACVGRTTLFNEIKDKRLIARKKGRRTVILRADLEAWLTSLPPANASRAAA